MAGHRAVPQQTTVELELTDLAYGGDAVGRYEGRAIFVPGGLPQEHVRVRLTRERGTYARAQLLEVLRPAPERVAPRYPELAETGGLQWQHIAYPAQVEWKTRITRQVLQRIGRFTEPPVLPTLAMPEGTDPWRSRTVAQFGLGPAAVGFRRMGSHDVLDMPACPVVHPALDALYQEVRAWMLHHFGMHAPEYAERFTLRVAVGAPEGAARLDGAQATAHAPGILTLEARPGSAIDSTGGPDRIGKSLLAAVPGLAGVAILGLPGGRGRMLYGEEALLEHVLHRTFRVSAGSFFQVNPAQTPVLVNEALRVARVQRDEWVLDGYSGVGLFSFFLAEQAAHVHAIESQPSAVADARASVGLNSAANVTITEGVLERALGTLQRQRERMDVVILDPPRSGCHPRALSEIVSSGPRALVYVSCDPSTLARDLRLLCEGGQYRLVSVQPVDMFPFTAHIECVALCERVR